MRPQHRLPAQHTRPLSFTLDHEQPLSRGGNLLDPTNARPTHRRCNSSKGNRIAVKARKQHPFGSGQCTRIRTVMRGTGGEAGQAAPGSRFLSASGIGFLGHPVPARELSLPRGRPTGPRRPGPQRVPTFDTNEIRPGLVLPLPRGGGLHLAEVTSAGQHLPLLSG
ncbi:HNH endonuclease [Streptomyces chartreusis]